MAYFQPRAPRPPHSFCPQTSKKGCGLNNRRAARHIHIHPKHMVSGLYVYSTGIKCYALAHKHNGSIAFLPPQYSSTINFGSSVEPLATPKTAPIPSFSISFCLKFLQILSFLGQLFLPHLPKLSGSYPRRGYLPCREWRLLPFRFPRLSQKTFYFSRYFTSHNYLIDKSPSFFRFRPAFYEFIICEIKIERRRLGKHFI